MKRLEAIVLAGGSGSRFGGGKLLAPYRGAPLIEGAMRTARAGPVRRIVLVTGHDADEIAKAASAAAGRDSSAPALAIVHADRHREGMAATLRTGIAALSPDTDGAFVFLGDMPCVPPTVAQDLAAAIAGRAAAAPVFRGARGHPALFSARLFPALLKMSGDQGARAILDALGDDLALLPVDDPGVVFDVDHPADLAS